MSETQVPSVNQTAKPRVLGWAVIGMGRAGQSRARLLEEHPLCRLVSTVSRRPGLGDATLTEVLADREVDAVVIATENARHAELAQTALEAGKHALVEYPLASCVGEARALYDLAHTVERVLHLEMIGLLTAGHASIRSWLTHQDIGRVALDFEGGYYRWVEDEARAARWGQLAVARLHALREWCGPLALEKVSLNTDADGYELEVELSAARVTEISLSDRRRRENKRQRTATFWGKDGLARVPPVVAPVGGLFRRDLDICISQISGHRVDGYVPTAQVIEMTHLAEQISACCAAM